jgi:cytochrome c oxidase cbb3-type subunit 3
VSLPRPAQVRMIPALRTWRLLAGVLLFCASGCDLPGRPRPADRWRAPREEKSFEALYGRNCAGCHGADGKLGPAPPLNDKLFLALLPDDELNRVVAEGRAGTLMPAFAVASGGQLTAEQVSLIAQGIRSRWGSTDSAPPQTPPYRLEASKLDRAVAAASGLKVFARACASCHGEKGQGGTFDGKPDGDPVGAINDPDFLALSSDQVLRRLIITGRPDLGMPGATAAAGRPGDFTPLTSAEVTELVALLASWRTGANLLGKEN